MVGRWDPWQEIDTLRTEINRLFEEGGYTRRLPRQAAEGHWTPRVDTYEDNECIEILVNLPGVTHEDVKLNVDNNVLTVSGYRRLENADKRENYHRIENEHGPFSRSFTIPASVEPEKAQAQMGNGILRIRLPKRAETKPKRIEVQAR